MNTLNKALHVSEEEENENLYLIFNSAHLKLGLKISAIKEIIELKKITRLNKMNEMVLGVVNIRGNVVPVVDLSQRLISKASVIHERSSIIVIQHSKGEDALTTGILVDEVNKFHSIANDYMEDTPQFGLSISERFLEKMGKVDMSFIPILNEETLLDINELCTLRS